VSNSIFRNFFLPISGVLSGLGIALTFYAPYVVLAQSEKWMAAEDIAQQNYSTGRFSDSTSVASFELISKSGQIRKLGAKSWTKLNEKFGDNSRLTIFTAPQDISGTQVLTIENTSSDEDIWLYLPALGKIRRVLPNTKGDSFVGTDFSYLDVIGYRPTNWQHRIITTEILQNQECWVIESLPKTPAIAEQAGLAKRMSWVRKDNFQAPKVQLFDLSNRLLKEILATDFFLADKRGNRWQPRRIEAINRITEHRTVLVFTEFMANVGVADNIFLPRNLEANRR